MGWQENACNRLMRAGDETSVAIRKLIAAAESLAQALVRVVPPEWYGRDLGMGYTLKPNGIHEGVFGLTKGPTTVWIGTSRGLQLFDAREIAACTASGFLDQLAKKIEDHRDEVNQMREAIEKGRAKLLPL